MRQGKVDDVILFFMYPGWFTLSWVQKTPKSRLGEKSWWCTLCYYLFHLIFRDFDAPLSHILCGYLLLYCSLINTVTWFLMYHLSTNDWVPDGDFTYEHSCWIIISQVSWIIGICNCRRKPVACWFDLEYDVFHCKPVKGGTQHSVVALSTLVTHIITIVLEVLQLEGGAMMFVEDQVQLILLISTHYNNCFIYKTNE